MYATTPAPNFWQMLPALLDICNTLRSNGNPARLNAINIYRDEQRGLSTDLETGEKTVVDSGLFWMDGQRKEVTSSQ